MDRISETTIAGKIYPLNFSVKAAREVDERFGGLENIGEAFSGDIIKAAETTAQLAHALICEGVAYRKIHDGVDTEAVTVEELTTLLSLGDIAPLQSELIAAMNKGMGREVAVEETEKNAEATQGD